MNTSDISERLQAAVSDAYINKIRLSIVGGNTKAFYGRKIMGLALRAGEHRGVIDYEPTELVITARAGTPLFEIEKILAEHNQMLAFEPPSFGDNSTLGGIVACGLSGPRRPFSGAVRDVILGCRILNGKAEILRFGGQVMKNVAGYDVSRLMAGALGTLGILLDISLKVLPKPKAERTLCFEMTERKALETMIEWCGQPLPLSGLCFDGQQLFARLAGNEGSISSAQAQIGGEFMADGLGFWKAVRDLKHRFFDHDDLLWRLSLPPAAPTPNVSGDWFFDWAGAQRWLKTSAEPREIFEVAAQLGGHATLFRSSDKECERFQPQPDKLVRLHQRLKHAFDPSGILNPGRMYAWL